MKILRLTRWPRVGRVDMGQLRRLQPISRDWGGDRGLAMDRYYIEEFLREHADDIRGDVLEVGDNVYTQTFGGAQVSRGAVVHAAEGNPQADYVADFADAPQLPSEAFDCLICTQTLHLVADLDAGLATIFRILRPGGVALITVPGISKIYRDEAHDWGDYWRFTPHSANWLLSRHFPAGQFAVTSKGNVLAATAFLYGLAAEELTAAELEYTDPDYPLSLLIRAQKPQLQ